MLAVAACGQRADVGPVVVSAIGGPPGYADPARGPLPTPDRLLIDATAQGLVRFDAAGQVESGLAERWTVIDGGTTFIFRLRAATWSDGRPVTADEVVAILRHAMAAPRDPLSPFLSAVSEIVVMTPQVVEVRLARPRPDLLRLFAQPELAVLRLRPVGGSGPLRIERGGAAPLLRPLVDPARVDPDEPQRPRPEDDVRLIGERAARAIARFAARRSDLVAGGTADDWPLLAAGGVAPANVRVDPAAGLFGLAVTDRSGFLADPANRAALAAALDRAAITGTVSPGWTAAETVLPDQLDSAAPPAAAAWTALSAADRLATAAAQVHGTGGDLPVLRIALPPGPGGTLLYGGIAAGLRRIGIATMRVGWRGPAALRLVDEVAPYDSARWYLATACQPCGDAARAAIDAARDAPTLADRAARLAEADQALMQDAAFIPLARPLRWSLVAQRLLQWQPNARAWHPLNRLRAAPM